MGLSAVPNQASPPTGWQQSTHAREDHLERGVFCTLAASEATKGISDSSFTMARLMKRRLGLSSSLHSTPSSTAERWEHTYRCTSRSGHAHCRHSSSVSIDDVVCNTTASDTFSDYRDSFSHCIWQAARLQEVVAAPTSECSFPDVAHTTNRWLHLDWNRVQQARAQDGPGLRDVSLMT